jgi:hypothetical protein
VYSINQVFLCPPEIGGGLRRDPVCQPEDAQGGRFFVISPSPIDGQTQKEKTK